MLRLSVKQSFSLSKLRFQILASCGLGLLLGIAFLWLSPLLAFGALAAIICIYAIIKRPELGLLGILVATSSIVFEAQLPMLSMGGISLHISDLILLALLGLIVVRSVGEPGFKFVHTPLDWPLLIFLGVTLLSTFIALYHSSVDSVDARRWIRVLAYYLTFFVVTNLVRERRQLNFLVNGFFLLGTMVASVMVVQFLLGDSVQILSGRIGSLVTEGTVYEDVTRILPPGYPIVIVSFMAIICILSLEKFNIHGWLKFLQVGLFGIGVILTFLRSYWAALFLVLILLGFLLRGGDRKKLFVLGGGVITTAAIVLLLIFSTPGSRATRLVGASIDRLSTLANSGTFTGQDSSVNWRMIENGYALTAIATHPIIGMGMGFTYRPWDSRLDQPWYRVVFDFRKFVHNGYLWILLQSGLLGFLSLMWLLIIFLLRGFRSWRSIPDSKLRGVMLSFTLFYVGVLIAEVVNSTFMQWKWIPVIGIIMGTNEVILRIVRQNITEI